MLFEYFCIFVHWFSRAIVGAQYILQWRNIGRDILLPVDDEILFFSPASHASVRSVTEAARPGRARAGCCSCGDNVVMLQSREIAQGVDLKCHATGQGW